MSDTILAQRVRNYVRGTDVHGAKLTESAVREIRRQLGVKNIALAAEYGVSESAIELVKNRKTWKHIL